MSTFMFVADVKINGEEKMHSGMCHGLTAADAQADAVRKIEEDLPGVTEVAIKNIRDWIS